MYIQYPQYYKAFSCIAGACSDSCCKEWEVALDTESVAVYQSLPGDLGDKLRQVIRQEDGLYLMTIEHGRCPMWRNDGLCMLQAEFGHDILCETCRDFPRLRHEYPGFTERDLELSCPEAARLIFFGDPALITEGQRQDTEDEVLDILLQSRETAYGLMAKTDLPLPRRLAVLLLYAHSVQAWIDGAEPAQPDVAKALADAQSFAGQPDVAAIVDFYKTLETLTDRWKICLASPKPGKWDEKLTRFMNYGIRRYWLQAVSDYDLLCRVKFLISACILITCLGGDTVQTAQLWSKETENNADNVEALLDAAYCQPAFTDVNLLGILMREV